MTEPPSTACPNCRSPLLEAVAQTDVRLFFRCEQCAHVFHVDIPCGHTPDRRALRNRLKKPPASLRVQPAEHRERQRSWRRNPPDAPSTG